MTIETECLEQLYAAIDWALDEKRLAWQRALSETSGEPPRYARRDLIAARAAVVEQVRPALAEWFEGVRPSASLEQLEDLATTSAEWLWFNLVCMNQGIFAENGDPLRVFRTYVPSQRPADNPLYLSPCADGFGYRQKT